VVQSPLPLLVRQREDSTSGGGRTADVVNQDVDASKTLERLIRGLGVPRRSAEICLHEVDPVYELAGHRACRGNHGGAGSTKTVDDSPPHALGATCHQGAF